MAFSFSESFTIKIPEWTDQALCAQTDPELFFPDKGGTAIARKICAPCPVKNECLEWAISENIIDGILGGMTARERRKTRRKS